VKKLKSKSKEEKFEIALEWLRNAARNCDNIKILGMAIVPIVKQQIENAIKYLEGEEVDEDVFV